MQAMTAPISLDNADMIKTDMNRTDGKKKQNNMSKEKRKNEEIGCFVAHGGVPVGDAAAGNGGR